MMKRSTKIVCAVVVATLFVTGGVFAAMSLFGEFAGIEKERLKKYEYSSGGDMLGGSYSQSVQEYNEDSTIVTIMQRKWHGADDVIKEYLVDKEILNELKAVFVKYRMKNWHNKKFTNTFIADGASGSHLFKFETRRVSFSSQHYPEKYASKLKELNEVWDKYWENATPLPGLRIDDTLTKDDGELPYDLNNGKIILSVYSYSYYQKCLCYRLANGTKETKKAEFVIRLYRDGESTPIYERSSEVTAEIDANSTKKGSIELEKPLTPGKYRLEAVGYTTEFEIQ